MEVNTLQVTEILTALEADNSRLYKDDILVKNRENALLRRTFRVALDPYINFGVSQLPKLTADGTEDGDDVLESFLNLLEHTLAPRLLSGNAARDSVECALREMSPRLRGWATRILLKNLRVGVSEKSINKVWPKTINRFEVMLATVVDCNNGKPINVRYPVYVEPKLDGLRMIAIKHSGIVTFFTRNGNEIETLPTIHNALAECTADEFVLDGEIMADAGTESWNESNSVVMSSSSRKDDSNMFYNVFDMMSYDEWVNQRCPCPHEQRKEQLAAFVAMLPMASHVRKVHGGFCHDLGELLSFYEKCLDDGYEGVMLKDSNALYQFKRSDAIRKFKPVQTYEGAVVGWYRGAAGKKREGVFAGFHVLLPNGAVTRVGNGFSDVLKKEINDSNPDTFIGRVVEVEGQPPLTKDGKIRFPVLLRFRSPTDVDPLVMDAYDLYVANR